MNEGWIEDEYLVLLSEAEIIRAMGKYQFDKYLPGYRLVGLRGWDEFIVADTSGTVYSLPTIPLAASNVELFSLSGTPALTPDPRFSGKIKWYVTPLIFGGDPQDKANLAWVSHDQHSELVVWWNAKYRELKAQAADA
jgi:hypothetical protein